MDPDEVAFRVEVAVQADGTMVTPYGELDMATQDELRTALESHVANGGLTLDLSGLRFMDTAGLRLILELAERSRREGLRFRVLAGPPAIQRLFEVAGVADLVPFGNGRQDLDRGAP